MPASPSFPSGTRGSRWKRRRRDSNPSSSRNKQPPFKDDNNDSDNEDNNAANDLDEDADVNNNNSEGPEDSNPNPNPNSNPNPNPSSGSGLVRTREMEVVDGGGVRISEFPLAIARVVNRPHSSVLALVAAERANAIGVESVGSGGRESSRVCLENVSYGQLQALSTVPADSPRLLSPVEREREEAGEGERDGERAASVMPTPPSIIEGSGVVKRFGERVHVLPMHSDWFSPSTVHRLERQVVPHFFSGKSADHTPEKYMECRNHIVAKYMDDPNKRLTIFDCCGSFRGIQDDDLGRIFRFLEHWGIINYCAATSRERESWNSSAYLKEDQNGEVHVPAASLKSIDSLIKFEKPKCQRKAADMYKTSLHKSDSASDLDSRIREHLSENHCIHCSRPLLVVYYRSLKEADVYLCNYCFHEGRFVVGHSSLDFARFDSMKTYDDIDGESWTDQETLLLLEGMELYPENWSEIAEHVGSKSKAQCILHFLRLPMEDGLLKNVEVPGVSPSSTVTNGNDQTSSFFNSNGNVEGIHLRDVEPASRLPFANSGNPVMSLVSFLASAVAPRVAAAAAHAALGVLCADDCLNESGNNLPVDRTNSGMTEDNVQHKGSGDLSNTNTSTITAEKVTAAAKAGLVAAAMKAKLFADHEEREIQRLSANIINNQLKRLELKLKQFAEIETLLMKECEQVEKTRQRFTTERVRISSSRFGAGGVASEGGSSSGVNNISNNNSRQGLASSSSQQSASGFMAANQPSYPSMPFMQQRQQMFPHGPRLPLSAINTSAATSASVAPSSGAMFNAPGNAQPNLNHPMLRSLPGANSSVG
ncbi:hypothetical protein MLD38_000467 [Melastoma candidum]|uniref:Uncharacterized protein n=1 Tax=Melastoma candidum TaxID=119954 RepID=A0ACB9SA86_9MYRT|nr:hypothetical protein MLD38_000467 [Melastoma candidum]